MARTVAVIGNDGSGKTTHVARVLADLQRSKIPVQKHAYYSSVVRSKMRGATERLTGASKKKLDPAARSKAASSSTDEPSTDTPPASATREARFRSGPRALALLAFLWIYQLGMAIEARIRDWRAEGVLLQDRSFVDDLASILEIFKLATPVMLVRISAHLFPLRRVIYLCAGHEVEFSRIVELDLSKELHRRKGERYEQMVRILEEEGVRVERVSTAPRP